MDSWGRNPFKLYYVPNCKTTCPKLKIDLSPLEKYTIYHLLENILTLIFSNYAGECQIGTGLSAYRDRSIRSWGRNPPQKDYVPNQQSTYNITLSSFQISFTYSSIVLSEVNLPQHAVLSSAILAHPSVSIYASSTCFCASA